MVCKCSSCWTFAEWALENLGSDYGLPRATGYHSPREPAQKPAEVVTFPVPRPEPSQPWEPRISRYAA